MVTVISSRVFPRPRHNTHEATDLGAGTEPKEKIYFLIKNTDIVL